MIYCCETGKPAEYHHVLGRKTRPDLIDEPWNKMPVSREIHQFLHQHGMNRSAKLFRGVKEWLIKNGWYYDDVMLKWFNDKATKRF